MACYTLMNKDYPVLEFEYDLKSRVVTRIVRMVDAARAPLGLIDERGRTSKRDFNYWWRHRAIPTSREQVERLLENLRLDSTLELVELRTRATPAQTRASLRDTVSKWIRNVPSLPLCAFVGGHCVRLNEQIGSRTFL